MNVGVIGCGGMGTTHYLSLKALSAQMIYRWLRWRIAERNFWIRRRVIFQSQNLYIRMDLIAGEQLDIVHICLPSYLHADHAVAAMEKGMNVLVEKPVCLTKEDCEKLLEAEREPA